MARGQGGLRQRSTPRRAASIKSTEGEEEEEQNIRRTMNDEGNDDAGSSSSGVIDLDDDTKLNRRRSLRIRGTPQKPVYVESGTESSIDRKMEEEDAYDSDDGEGSDVTLYDLNDTAATVTEPIKGRRAASASARKQIKRKLNNSKNSDLDDDSDYSIEIVSEHSADEIEEPKSKRRRSTGTRKQFDSDGEDISHLKPWEKAKRTITKRIERNHPELKEVWSGDKLKPMDVLPFVQPNELAVTLLPFQQEGLGWFLQQEQTKFRGGILADEMGMGKTIQMISLLLSDEPKRTTLVVCPTVALLQWRSEIENRAPGALKVMVFHGLNKDKVADQFGDHNVVLTTYGTVEQQFRYSTQGRTKQGKKYYPESPLHKFKWFRIILDEAHAIKDRSSQTARAVFHLHTNKRWSLSGTPLQNRVGELYSLIRFQGVYPYAYYFCNQCPCASPTWNMINGRTCADCGHRGMNHFCWWNREILKPIQNFGGQGEGRVAFNKLGKMLRAFMLRRTKLERASDLGLPPRTVVTRKDYFNDEEEDFYEALYTETSTKFMSYVHAGTVLNNYAHIFDLLMRMRQAANHPWLVLHNRRFDKSGPRHNVCGICHEAAEDAIAAKCSHIFCRECMRQYLDSTMESEDQVKCPICFRHLTIDLEQETVQLDDLSKASGSKGSKRSSGKDNILQRIHLERWRSSTKIEALLEELTHYKQNDRTVKSIVFSQFTNFLDLLDWRLQRMGIRSVKLDGRMGPAARDAMIQAFNTDPNITVFLISLKAGGVALNLTEASRVYIMDPWWNPAVEDQAMDRIHRLGQHRSIVVKRMIIENSIESRIVELQEKKKLLFESTVGMDQNSLQRLSENDLRFLFQL
eukprot:Clim_evm50s201 gene=Clim_evmTU50s201